MKTKAKGDRFERQVRRDLEEAGIIARRIVGGAGDPGDVLAAPWLFECKHQKRPSPLAALEQAEELAGSTLMAAQGVKHAAAVVQRHGDRKGPTVTMRWSVLLGLLREHRSLQQQFDEADQHVMELQADLDAERA